MPSPLEDPYVYPDTRVLRNTRGIRDADQLTRVEADVTALALAELAERGLPGGYDLAHLRAFHRAIFSDLYPWAGEVRTVTISKPGSLFALPQHIESAAADIFGRLARANQLRGLDRDSFIEQVAELWGDIDALHPFREGNGRATSCWPWMPTITSHGPGLIPTPTSTPPGPPSTATTDPAAGYSRISSTSITPADRAPPAS